MTPGFYRNGTSLLHRMPAGAKLLLLLLSGTLVLLSESLAAAAVLASLVLLLYGLARLPLRVMLAQIRPALPVLLLVFLFQLFSRDAAFAGAVVLRFAALLMLAALVTLTTPVSALIAVIERRLAFLRFVGIDPAKAGLALSLALRFIPVLAAIAAEVREAQRARGLEWSLLAMTIPTVIRTLKMAEDVAAAIDARGFET